MGVIPASNSNRRRYEQLLNTVGRNTMHSLFPRDFEAYFISMELTDSRGVTEAFITFPVQPEQITETSTRITNVKKSAGGVVVVGTETFVPIDIDIKGNFGRGFRFMIGNRFVNAGLISSVRKAIKGTDLGYIAFSNTVKTGYGVVKAIESMIDSSDVLDADGLPKRLYLYNTVLGNNYVVRVKNFVHSQNQSQNMIPQYTLQLYALAPLDNSLFGQVLKLGKSMAMDALNKGANNLAKSVQNKIGL